MPVLYMGIIRLDPESATQLCGEISLDALAKTLQYSPTVLKWFFEDSHKKQLVEICETAAHSKRDVERLTSNEVLEEKELSFHINHQDVTGVMVTDPGYDRRVAHHILNQILEEFLANYKDTDFSAPPERKDSYSFPQLEEYIKKYQDPSEVDSILKIKSDLDETKITLVKAIESLLERGEKLSNLKERSDDLSTQSQQFYKKAKQQNSCCVLM